MKSVYLACLVVGGAFAILSAFGSLRDGPASRVSRDGPLFSLRSLVYSLVGFGVTGTLGSRIGGDPNAVGLFVAALLVALLFGGMASSLMAFAVRPRGPSDSNDHREPK